MTRYKVRVTTSEGGKARIEAPVEYVLAMRALARENDGGFVGMSRP